MKEKFNLYKPIKMRIILYILIIILGVIAGYSYINKKIEQQYRDCINECSRKYPSSGFYRTKEEAQKLDTCELQCKELRYNIKSIINSEITLLTSDTITIKSDAITISLEQIQNVGYNFYIGQIEYQNAPVISDDTKNKITQVIYKANFPKNLLKNIGIVIVNTLAVSEYQYIKTPNGTFDIPSFDPNFMTGGGVYSRKLGEMSLIFINKTQFEKLSEILTHELGHYIGDQLTSEEWKKYYELRRIPSNTSRRGQSWQLSPNEDFAEVYRSIYTESKVRTYYGLLVRNGYLYSEYTCGSIYDKLMNNYKKIKYPNTDPWMMPFITEEEAGFTTNTELQNCRREILANPEEYPEDWNYSNWYGPPYYSVVDQSTKNFITEIITRLNRI